MTVSLNAGALQISWAQRIDNFNIPFRDEDDTARNLSNGIEAYRHFLEGNGADRSFSYDEFVSEDPSGQTVLNNAIADTQRGAEDLYNQMIARDPSLAGKPITFDICRAPANWFYIAAGQTG